MVRPNQQGDPAMQKNWVFETEPVLDVEVSLLAAPGAHVDWVRGNKRDEAIRVIVDKCAAVFGDEISGRIAHVRHSNFNHHGMTVHITIAARESERLDELIARDLGAIERSLEATLQSHFGWEQAAVSVQIDPNPAYEARGGRRTAPRPGNPDDINVWQPGGGSNAIAPVIVTVPSPGPSPGPVGDKPVHILPYPPKQGSAAVAGLLGAVCAIGVAILVGVVVGPLTDEIGGLYRYREITAIQHAATVSLNNQQIASLRGENRRLRDTVSRLASRRGQPAMRSDQPTRALPDTDATAPLPTATPPIGPTPGLGAP
jgi:hypothetical protein